MKMSLLLLTLVLVALASVPHASAADLIGVGIQVTDDHIDFTLGSELVGRYNKGPSVAKPYFWPLRGPEGIPVTRAWPMEKETKGSTDHPHQKSVWFCHGDVIPEGIPTQSKSKDVKGVDFWSEGEGHGRIVCTHVGNPKLEKGHGQIETRNEWRTADGTKVLDETRTLHLHDLGTARLLVFDIDLHASVVPITFGDTKEGSFGIRINDAIRSLKGSGTIENAEGKKGEISCWGVRSDWCDYSGPIDGKTVGIAIFNGSPKTPVCWHSRGYGLMAANPFGRKHSGFPAVKTEEELVKLAKGEHLKLRYGLLVHPGDAREGKVSDHFQTFLKLAEAGKPDKE